MKRKKMPIIILIIILTVALLQAAIFAYTLTIGNMDDTDKVDYKPMQIPSATMSPQERMDKIIISDEINTLIKESDPLNYEKNIKNYKEFLIMMNVHEKFKGAIESFIKDKYKLPDLIIAYSFLNERYGTLFDFYDMIKSKNKGQKWIDIFNNYEKNNPEFVPRNFNSDYLDNLLSSNKLELDDVMICDRISQKLSKPFEDIIKMKINGDVWRDIKTNLNILNGQSKIDYIPMTKEQIENYSSDGKLSKEKVAEGIVLANKTGKQIEDIIKMMKSGSTKMEILVKYYEEKYY